MESHTTVPCVPFPMVFVASLAHPHATGVPMFVNFSVCSQVLASQPLASAPTPGF